MIHFSVFGFYAQFLVAYCAGLLSAYIGYALWDDKKGKY